MSDPTLRDADIRRAVEARRVDDTKIMQKVNAVNREGFKQRFPGALEHNMRLINERLQHCLSKPDGIDLSQPHTWPASSIDIAALAEALWHLEQVRLNWPQE
jgi:hypothetical protein